jgi:hypothetical protein
LRGEEEPRVKEWVSPKVVFLSAAAKKLMRGRGADEEGLVSAKTPSLAIFARRREGVFFV